MAGFNLNQGGTSRGYSSRRRQHRAIAEINVTPFVDVMLVLLIVFMVTAPMLTAGVAVDLPRSDAAAISTEDNKPLEVSLKTNGNIYVGETEVTIERLPILLKTITESNPDRRIYVRADQGLDYGSVMNVLGTLNKAGLKKVALITKPQ